MTTRRPHSHDFDGREPFATSPSEGGTHEASKPRILFVDDEMRVLDGLRRSLKDKRAAWELEFHSDPATALAAHQGSPFDAVVSDIAMPGMTGLELIQEMQKVASDTVYIILTGTADLATAVDAINKVSVYRFFTKPCAGALVAEGIAAGLAARRVRQQPDNDSGRFLGLSTLDRLPFGVLVVDSGAHVQFANRAGAAVVAQKDGLALSADGTCRGSQTAETAELLRLCALACSGDGAAETGLMTIERPSLKRPFMVLVAALPRDDSGPKAAIFVVDHDSLRLPAPEAIAALHGLTRSEARLVSALMESTSLESAAEKCALTLSTARTYLKQIFAKTGTTRQSELLKLVLSTPAVA